MNILFETDLFEEERAVWESRGASIHETIFDDRKLNKFAPTVARGSIQFHNSVGSAFRQKGWPDLRWPFSSDWKRYDYLFLSMFPNILNADADFGLGGKLTASQLLEREYEWPRWIRSVDGTKGMTGSVCTKEEFEVQAQFLKQQNSAGLPLVTARLKEIYEEFRLIFVDKTYISGSEYHYDGRKAGDTYIPAKILKFGKEWAAEYGHNWNGTFVLDIATTDRGYKVVEVNNLLTSGWYNADVEAIADTIIRKVETLKK